MSNQHEIKKFARLNFLTSTNQEDIKKLTLCTTRLDLHIDGPLIVDTFSPAEKDHKAQWPYNDFNYQISSLGFRTHADLQDSDVGAFGCSFTFGQGLPADSLWPSLLAKSTGMSLYNFGQPGIGAKGIADLFAIISNIVNIKHAVFLLPPYHRLQLAAADSRFCSIDLVPIIPNYVSKHEGRYRFNSDDVYRVLPEEELLKNFKDAVYQIEYIASAKGIKTYYSSWEKETYKFLTYMDENLNLLPEWTSKSEHNGVVEYLNTDFARDMQHPGPKHHENWARQIKDFIK